MAANVIFYNRFVTLEELKEFIGAADIYITPYLNESQITSGTLAYTYGAGKAVISTPYWRAKELKNLPHPGAPGTFIVRCLQVDGIFPQDRYSGVFTQFFLRLGCARKIRNRSGGILRMIASPVARLHRKLHCFHHCAAENGRERRVRSIPPVSNAHEARLWSKAGRVEQDPAPPEKCFDIGVKVRWIQAVCIRAHESSWDSQ